VLIISSVLQMSVRTLLLMHLRLDTGMYDFPSQQEYIRTPGTSRLRSRR